MKKLLSMLLIVAMLLSMVLVVVPVGAAEGDGTNATLEAAGYKGITALSEITGGGKFYLKQNITVTSQQGLQQGSASNLTTLDGNGHTITYGSAETPCTDSLFGWSADVYIKNLTIKAYITTTENASNRGAALTNGFDRIVKLENVTCDSTIVVNSSLTSCGGVLCKVQNDGNLTMINVVNKGTITVAEGKKVSNLGGIIGYVSNGNFKSIKLENCRNEANIVVNGEANNVGGLVGVVDNNTAGDLTLDMDNCQNLGKITLKTTSGNTSAGGLVARCNANATIENSINGATDGYVANATAGMIEIPAECTSFEAIGGVAGVLTNNSTLTNCTNNGEIKITNTQDSGFIGGIAGNIWGKNHTYTGCVNNAPLNITRENAGVTAGIIGRNNVGGLLQIINCTNNGKITSGGKAVVAGILAQTEKSNTTIDGCTNNADISFGVSNQNSNQAIGGILGEIKNGGSNPGTGTYVYPPTDKKYIVKNSLNVGDITLNDGADAMHVGGIVGRAATAPHLEIDNCINRGDLTAKNAVGWADIGGIIGSVMSVHEYVAATNDWWWGGISSADYSITNCKNYGAIDGKTVGGIVGAAHQLYHDTIQLTIRGCYNYETGTVNGSDGAGGIVGKYSINGGDIGGLTVSDCVNKGAVTGAGYAAGIVALNGSNTTTKFGSITGCSNTATITGTGGAVAAGIIAGCNSNVTLSGNVNTGDATNPIAPEMTSITVTAQNNIFSQASGSYGTIFTADTLRAKITEAGNLNADLYTTTSFAGVTNAKTAAETALENSSDLAGMVTAYENLNEAMGALVTKEAFYKDINAAITLAGEKVEAEYTSGTWAAMQTAKTNAQTAVTNGNENATEIANLTKTLNDAIDGLVRMPNLDALNAAISNAEAKASEQNKYTSASWSAMQTKLTAAREASVGSRNSGCRPIMAAPPEGLGTRRLHRGPAPPCRGEAA